jgi:nucleoside phosphorylase
MADSQVDFAIVTAIDIERKAVCDAFGLTEDDRVSKESRVYWCKSLELKKGEFYNIVVAQLPDMASVDAALLASDISNHWHPGAILLVGIAAGVDPEKQQLGDLVVGRDVYYYERDKQTPEGKRPALIMYRADATLWNHVQTVPDWVLPNELLRPDHTQTIPKIHYEVIASGEKVIADSAVRDEIITGHRKIAAIEMEGYGFSAGVWQSFKPIRHLVIKAICDFADAGKRDDWQSYAAAVAAHFTKHFLLDRPLDPLNPARQPPPPPSQYRPIIEELMFGNIVPFLGPGINPDFYIQLASRLTELIAADLRHEPTWNVSEEGNLIQRLIGVPCQVCHYLPNERPGECPILKRIKRVETCPLYLEQRLAVAKMNLRYLAQYYRLTNISLHTFYDTLCEIFETIGSHCPNQVHQFFAELPDQMRAKHYPRRCPGLPYQLIVTTNCDSLLESAFDEVGQCYDVVYYVADGNDRGKYKHRPYRAEAAQIIDNPENYDQLPLRETGRISSSRELRPIILKLYGTWDNNFVVTEDHLNFLVSSPIKNLPSGLIGVLKEAGIFFLGYSPNDSDLQLIVNWLWQNKQLPKGSWLVHQSQPGDLERKIWEDQRNVELLSITCSPEDYVASLKQEIEALESRSVRQRR